MNELELLLGLGIAAGVIFILLVIGLIFYILKSIGLFGMAKKAGIQNAWLAWIPVGDQYITGKLVGKINLFNNEINNLEIILPIVNIITFALARKSFLGGLITTAFAVLNFVVLYYLYKKYKGDKAVGMLILSIIIPVMAPIFLFTLRNAEPIGGFYYGSNERSNDGFTEGSDDYQPNM
ncbi:hypothetical protein [Defluviitalea saccharophila]|uniref:Uncharacterized protein n=1 Tax=Defluviitalea saccharophila TaxID=879970 RepID=A0ABZ2Y2R7_9FIRM